MLPGTTYRLLQPIKDYYGGLFLAGEEMTYVQRHFLPYHGGHTIVFEGRTMYLQEETNADILGALSQYLEVARPANAA